MKKLTLVLFSFVLYQVSSSLEVPIIDLNNEDINSLVSGDPTWPRQCVRPLCDTNRHLRFPRIIAREFYQCQLINNVWTAMIFGCPCDHLFDYMAQTCLRFDNASRFEWCLNNQDPFHIACGTPGTTTTTAPETTTTTTTPVTTTTPSITDTTATTTATTVTTTTTATPGATPPPGTTVWTPPGGTPPGGGDTTTTTTQRYSTVTMFGEDYEDKRV